MFEDASPFVDVFLAVCKLARLSLMTNAVIKIRIIAMRSGTGISIEEGMLISSADICEGLATIGSADTALNNECTSLVIPLSFITKN